MSSPHGTSSGDHSSGLKGLDAALLQSQLVCLFYICVTCLITRYRGTVRGCAGRPLCARARARARAPALCSPHATPSSSALLLVQAWHNDGWHLPMVVALAFSTWLKLKSVSSDGAHSA